MRVITIDQLDEANIHLMGAHAILKIIEISAAEGALDDLNSVVLSEAVRGIGLMLNTASEALNGDGE